MEDRVSMEELEQMEADLLWWKVLEAYIPEWQVFGFTYRHSASIDTGNGLTITLRGFQRDQIVSALFRAEGRIK